MVTLIAEAFSHYLHRPLPPRAQEETEMENQWMITVCSHWHKMSIISIHVVFFLLFPDNRKGNKKKKGQRQQKTNLAAATTKLPGNTHRQGAAKPIKRLHSRVGPTKSKATIKNKPIKCALGQSVCSFINQEDIDPTKDNGRNHF